MKKRLFLLLLTLFFIPGVVNAYEMKEEYFSFGGSGRDFYNDVAATSDGGYVAVGVISNGVNGIINNGGTDAVIVKYDQNGKIEWQRNYGGPLDDQFNSVIETTSGEYLAVGSVGSDTIIAKFDKYGNIVWQKKSSGSFSGITITSDGGYVAVGKISSTNISGITTYGGDDAVIVKFDQDGNVIWQQNYGGMSSDVFSGITITSDGGYVAVGKIRSTNISGITTYGGDDAVIVKFDQDGNVIWQQNYGGSALDSFESVALASDGGYIAVGSTSSTDIEEIPNSGSNDAIIVKYDKNGKMEWQKNYGGSSYDSFSDIAVTSDEGCMVAGTFESNSIDGVESFGYVDAVIVKYDKDGKMEWHKNHGGSSYDSFLRLATTLDGGYVAVGHSFSSNIENISYKGYSDAFIFKASVVYNITTEETTNGTFEVTQEGYRARIMFTSEKGYELDEIIVTDSQGNKVEYYEEDGEYYVNLTDDINVNVTFKKETINPDTGVMQVIDILVILALIVGGIFYFRRKRKCA